MIRQASALKLGWILALAVILLALGLIIDLAFTEPAIREVTRLTAQRQELLGRSTQAQAQDTRNQELAGMLGVQKLGDLLSKESTSDPLSYLGRAIDERNLTRLDLSAGDVIETKILRRAEFTLRLLGGYEAILNFIGDLERGTRLVTVDAFVIETVMGSSKLECRLRVSIYDPVVGSGS